MYMLLGYYLNFLNVTISNNNIHQYIFLVLIEPFLIVYTYENSLMFLGCILLKDLLYQFRLHLMLDLEYTNLYFHNLKFSKLFIKIIWHIK